MSLQLGTFGAWFSPAYDDDTRVRATRRVLAALGDRALRLARDRAAGTHPYLGLRNYVSNLHRHGFSPADTADRGSDRLIDALVLHGTPQTITAGLTAHLQAGADHVAIQVLVTPGHDPMPGYRQLAKTLLREPRKYPQLGQRHATPINTRRAALRLAGGVRTGRPGPGRSRRRSRPAGPDLARRAWSSSG